MNKYIVKRILAIIPVLLGITIFAFLIGVAAPGDPVYIALTRDGVTEPTEAEIEEKRHELKLDLPLPMQYYHWLKGIAVGDFGKSIYSNEDIKAELARRMPVTIKLACLAFAITMLTGLVLGALMSAFYGSFFEQILKTLCSLLMSTPAFWFGIILITIFSEYLQILPSSGIDSWKSYILPAITLSISAIGVSARLARANFLAEISKQYVLVANAKGLRNKTIAFIHIFPNALIPLVTFFGIYFAGILGGTSVIESLFSLPGLGSYVIEAIFNRDYFIIEAYVLFTGLIYVGISLIIDLLYFALDPKIRQSEVDAI